MKNEEYKFNDDVRFVLKREIRFFILVNLKNKSKTPTELIKNNKYHITHISTNLKEMGEKGLVYCVNPNVRKNKKFLLTKKGKNILEKINELTRI